MSTTFHGIDEVTIMGGLMVARMGRVPSHVNSILTMAAAPGLVPDGTRHRHFRVARHTSSDLHAIRYAQAADWVAQQWYQSRTVLIRDEEGRQQPGLVAALMILQLGGTVRDAIARIPWQLEQHYLDFLHDERLPSSLHA